MSRMCILVGFGVFCPVLKDWNAKFGAGDGIQTRGLYLGRVPLYQLSYARKQVVTPTGFEPVFQP